MTRNYIHDSGRRGVNQYSLMIFEFAFPDFLVTLNRCSFFGHLNFFKIIHLALKIHKTNHIFYITFWYSWSPKQDRVLAIIVVTFPSLPIIVVSRNLVSPPCSATGRSWQLPVTQLGTSLRGSQGEISNAVYSLGASVPSLTYCHPQHIWEEKKWQTDQEVKLATVPRKAHEKAFYYVEAEGLTESQEIYM